MTKSDGREVRSPGWWIPGFDQSARESSVERIAAGSMPGLTYYILIVLSSLIAGYGLLANSTATVIGAMIVAPLMGPILGLALGIVIGDTKMFRRSLAAESSGVILVIAVGFLVAQAVGVDQIDFSASEIANRTRPTLYDLAIGLAAGLAGAFCMVHPGLQASVAGVAIAVALVPPLAVTGITTAGWLSGNLPWRPAFGSFVLFLANYLTIELAACLLFYACGFHFQQKRQAASFRRAILVNLVLLLLTGVFLSQQLQTLIDERVALVSARDVLRRGLAPIPGADLDSVDVTLNASGLTVTAVIGTRREITPRDVASLEKQLKAALARRLPDASPKLVVRTVGSEYITSQGYLFEPEGRKMSATQQHLQDIEVALRKELETYPEVELDGFRPLFDQQSTMTVVGPGAWNLELTLRSPFDFTPEMVDELETKLNAELAVASGQEKLRLLVRTVIVQSSTSGSRLEVLPPDDERSSENLALRKLLMDELEKDGYAIAQFALRRRSPQVDSTSTSLRQALTEEAYDATVQVRGKAFLDQAKVAKIRSSVLLAYRQSQGRPIGLRLRVDVILSDSVSDG